MIYIFISAVHEVNVIPWIPEVFSLGRWGASSATGRGYERQSREKKPLAQSALIYCAGWTLTLSLFCQSNRRSPANLKVITNGGKGRNDVLKPKESHYLQNNTKTHRDFVARRAASRLENLVPPRFKNSFSNVKLVSEVNCSKSSNICLICWRSSVKSLKDINKNAISTRLIFAKVSRKLDYNFIALVFLNMYACL